MKREDLSGELSQIKRARDAVKFTIGGKKSLIGYINCPKCNTGDLNFIVNRTGKKIWAWCTSKKCIIWVE